MRSSRSVVGVFVVLLLASVVESFRQVNGRKLLRNQQRSETQKFGVWGNYKSDGRKEGLIILGLASLITVKINFMSVDLRTTYLCPSGPNAEKTRAVYLTIEGWKCLPLTVSMPIP
jgi:hypothetical protein